MATDLLDLLDELAVDEQRTTTGKLHPDTSLAAAVRVLGRSGSQRRRVFDLLAQGGLTDPEISERLRLSPNSERPRRVELVNAGLVEPAGTKVLHGQAHTVWQVTAAARRLACPS